MATAFDTPNSLFLLMLVITILLACSCTSFVEARNWPPRDEVNALKEIAEQLGKKDWNFSLNPCDGNSTWNTYTNIVFCNCPNAGGVCHIEAIDLTGQDLTGVLPPSLAKLPYIKRIDLSYNYLQGTIPREWASTKLEYMNVGYNRLSGPIPKNLGDITTLTKMSLQGNLFNGSVPAELGKLINLTYLGLSNNNFTGKLPSFQSWKQLQVLEIQAGGFEGPIPSNIYVLRNLTRLVITDLNGGDSEFPNLDNMTGLTLLVLRNCNISGKIPVHIAQMNELGILDLSFNKLEGEIPDDLQFLSSLEYMYLTSNFLTGTIPSWIENRGPKVQIDLSYNNFSKGAPTCRETLNLFRSYSGEINSELDNCLSPFPCSEGTRFILIVVETKLPLETLILKRMKTQEDQQNLFLGGVTGELVPQDTLRLLK